MTGEAAYADWIAVDWGTTNLRAWAMRDGRPVAEATSDKGMGVLDRADFEPALLELIDPWLGQGRMSIVACGMVGSRQGWVEAPYAAVPARPLGADMATPTVSDSRLDIRVIAGLKQASPADVMRGEETQIAGFLSANPAFDGVLCLPGTHSKWAQISAGEVVSFRTFMTGEMFSLLSKRSVLRLSVTEGWDADAFVDAVSDAMSRPEALAAKLFTLRAESLIAGLTGAAALSRLSGLLIGAELAAARPYWLGQNVALIGAERLTDAYATALKVQGLDPIRADATDATLAGLAAARALIMETTE
ncbi:2-keto-3-deoxy-galactonokinase [Alphaproteobacteria bacterium GH1-50]|uniref:2-keto-3-deoxy-galactonokinase n=1 Tax=Kangsaoukella pontilimi TaxID=2691042 RepID=A0A7C9MLD3_9RHOB|nr:2-dehydro-3-deoxygalactonokinase [Kangsaoukella pontilimi]MXQ09155.1 2-keto-3-deoxy-galactonokinase [Kangsaoukella pontilimi]